LKLELIERHPRGTARDTPLLFMHGAYTAAWCWDEYFLPYFARHGWHACALSARAHGGSPGRESLDEAGIEDYVSDLLTAAGTFNQPPVLVGHSMGAIVVQRAARRCDTPGQVLLAPVPPHGLAGSWFSLATRDPPLMGALQDLQFSGAAAGVAERRLRRHLFSESLTEDVALRHLMRMQPESKRALFDLSWPQHFWIGSSVGIPALVLGAEEDAFFPPLQLQETALFHGVPAELLPGMGHLMMLEQDWRAAADLILQWLEQMC